MTSIRASKPQPSPSSTRRAVTAAFASGPDRFIELPHGRLAYWKFGHGPDVVLVHGWPLSGATFRASIPTLAESFTVHVIDLPGAGRTEWTGPVGFTEHAETLRQVIRALGLTSFAFVGHDSGGLIARLAAAGDSRVRGLVIADSELPNHHSAIVGALVAVAKLPGGVRAIGALMRVGPIRRSALGFGGCFRDPSLIDGEFGALFLEPLLSSPSYAARQFRTLANADFSVVDRMDALHATLTAPVRCIWGTDDPFFPIEGARAMLPSLPKGSDLVEIPGGKLFAHEEFPEVFAKHTHAFLAALSWSATHEVTAA